MTRINLIPVQELTDQHLLAEHREIKRIPNVILSGRYSLDNQPEEFTLGTGHVKFFYDKLSFLKNRYLQLYSECLKRGFNIQNYIDCFNPFIGTYLLFNDYIPTEKDIEISRQRIQEKIQAKPDFYKYYGNNLLPNNNLGKG